MAEKANKELMKALTPEFKASYANLFKASGMPGAAKLKFSVVMMFPKTTDLTVLKEAMKQSKIAKWGPQKDWPKLIESPVMNGDDPKYADKEGYAGHWLIKASSNEENRPGVVDQNCVEIINPAEFYSGCFARANVFAHAWEFAGRFGVSFILDSVQKMRDGKPFGGRKPASQSFSPVAAPTENLDGDAVEEQDFI